MANRLFFIAPIALAVSAAFIGAAAGPAVAATNVCATAPDQLRAAAATADASAQKKALYYVQTGVQLCDARAPAEASKKFAAAAKVLGTDLASLPVVTAAAQ